MSAIASMKIWAFIMSDSTSARDATSGSQLKLIYKTRKDLAGFRINFMPSGRNTPD